MQVVHENFGIIEGLMTTVHATWFPACALYDFSHDGLMTTSTTFSQFSKDKGLDIMAEEDQVWQCYDRPF